jgi:2'-5' RNA ligase
VAAHKIRQSLFSGQLVKATAEGEHVTIAFTADTPAQLRERLAAAAAAATERMQQSNAAILDAASTFEERQTKVYNNAVAQLRRDLGVTTPGDDAPVSHADNSAGQIHAPENP